MKRLEVVAGILWRGGKYLAVRRPEGGRMAGWWEFPGGQIEPGETPEAALVRELHEELGVTVTAQVYWQEVTHRYEAFEVHLRFYHVTGFDGEPQALEGQGMLWCDPDNQPELDFLEADLPIVRALEHFAV